jgi:hypothetical protein
MMGALLGRIVWITGTCFRSRERQDRVEHNEEEQVEPMILLVFSLKEDPSSRTTASVPAVRGQTLGMLSIYTAKMVDF